jgi:hypothetical protein
MSNIQGRTRDFSVDIDRQGVPLATFIGAVVAILFAVIALGASLTNANVAAQDPEPIILIGP